MAPPVLKESARKLRRVRLTKLMKEKVKSFAVLASKLAAAHNGAPSKGPHTIEITVTRQDPNEPILCVGSQLVVEDRVRVDVLAKLGTGTFGEVYKIKTSHLERCLAMKVVDTNTAKQIEKALHEVKILNFLDERDLGEFILENYHTFRFSSNGREVMCNVSELLDRPLADILDNTRPSALHPAFVKAIGFQVLSALECLHNIGITHCDIKPDNVMFVDLQHSKLRVKLIDFGNSHFTHVLPQGKRMQNIMYRAPEVLFGMPLTEKLDIWSFAVVLCEMFTGRDLFAVDFEPELARHIEGYVGLPRAAETGVYAHELLIYDEDEERPKVKTYSETQANNIVDCNIEKRVILSLLHVPFFGYNNRAFGRVTEEDRQFLDVLVKMMMPNAAERIGAKEALQSDYFRSFDGDYNPILLTTEPPVAGRVQIGSLYETFSSNSPQSTSADD